MHHFLPIGLLAAGLLLAPAIQAQQADALIAEGDTLLVLNNAGKAMEKFNAAVQLEPSAETYAARARGWFYQGKYEKFLQDLQDAMRLDSLHDKANCQRALYALRSGDNEGAIRFATRALKREPGEETRKRALVVRGEAWASTGANDKAIADLSEGLEGNKEDLQAMKTLARLYDAADDPAASLAVLEKLCELQPEDIGNWSNRGFELNRLERYQEAVQVLDRALQLDKDEPVVLSNKAYALMYLGMETEAMNMVNRSLKADKINPYALRTRALLYLRKGERDKACNDLTLAKAMGGAPEVDSLVKQHCAGIRGKR